MRAWKEPETRHTDTAVALLTLCAAQFMVVLNSGRLEYVAN
jgi:hypothetical protein